MGRSAPPSTSSPELRRKRTAAPPPEPPTPRRLCSMDDVMRRSRPVDAPPPVARAREAIYDAVLCDTCGSGDRDDELLLCDRCDRGRHTFCLRPIAAKVPIGPWFCPDCAPPAKPVKRFPMKQTKIVDFFRIQKDDQNGVPGKCRLSQDVRKRRKRSLVMHKKRRRILPFVPTEDRARRLKQMASLATALTSSETEFSNELTYIPNMAPRSSNQARLEEGGMQILPKEDKETIELCRAMQQRGECPPLLVVFDSCEGFTVQADADIKDMTFIAEYAGDVDYLENRASDDCDCIMTLLLTADPSQRLVICPDKRGNVSRFISGINNYTPDGKKKQNVKCVRYDIDGESHVLLVACRDIACGEKLYYDYNGYEHAYPTHHFL
ncbi:putative Histone-lysine N-methyltransferase ATXR5 [Panicum miliaceum]|uniref:[histone H3]-lysine(27) N-methyltransferase n=1 Tax=Panicum miliaceum TaxID=4540 RepID=A0A3L6PLC1_PANMI|nr:putative Histone-lysine N-methyltransferase ATXR5 [Panicum miliaceum]